MQPQHKQDTERDEIITHSGEIAGYRFEIHNVPAHLKDGQVLLEGHVYERVQTLLVAEIIRRGLANPVTFKFLRKRARLKAADFAELAGVSATTVSNWETGRHPIPPVVWAIAAHLGFGADVRQTLSAARDRQEPDGPIQLDLDAPPQGAPGT